MQLNAGAQPIGDARVLEPLDAPLDVVAEQVSEPHLVIVKARFPLSELTYMLATPNADACHRDFRRCLRDRNGP